MRRDLMQTEIWGSLGKSGEYIWGRTYLLPLVGFLKTESPSSGNYPKGERARRKLGYVCGAASMTRYMLVQDSRLTWP